MDAPCFTPPQNSTTTLISSPLLLLLSSLRLSPGLCAVPALSRCFINVPWRINEKSNDPNGLKQFPEHSERFSCLFFQPFPLLLYPHSCLHTNKYTPTYAHKHTYRHTHSSSSSSSILTFTWTCAASPTTVNIRNSQRRIKKSKIFW